MKKMDTFFRNRKREREREKKNIFSKDSIENKKPQFGKQARILIQPTTTTTTTIAGKKISLESIDQKTNNHRMKKTL